MPLHRCPPSILSFSLSFILLLLFLPLYRHLVQASPTPSPAMSPAQTPSLTPPPPPPPTTTAPRETIIYPIPSTTLTLTLTLNETQPLPYPAACALLASAATHIRTHYTASELVPDVFRYHHHHHNTIEASEFEFEFEFGITGGIFANELVWRDVLDVIEGLRGFYVGRWGKGGGEGEGEGGVGLIFDVRDEAGRGGLGDGYLEPRRGGSVEVDGGAHGDGEGEVLTE